MGSRVFFRADNVALGFDPLIIGDRQTPGGDPDEKKNEWWTKVARTDGTATLPGSTTKYNSRVNTNIHVIFNSDDEAKNYKIAVPSAYSSFITAENASGGSDLTQKDKTIKITGKNPGASNAPQHAQVSIESRFPDPTKSMYLLDVDLLPVRKIILGIYFVQQSGESLHAFRTASRIPPRSYNH